MKTPWGESTFEKKFSDDVIYYETRSHGGFWVNPSILPSAVNEEFISPFHGETGWFERDCEASLVVVLFPQLFLYSQVRDAHEFFLNYAKVTGENANQNYLLIAYRKLAEIAFGNQYGGRK